ncbi:MAG: hypothetical protein KGD58_01705 [Candidatus Lokiarchaeota archaeon]|nr:hypothetical protein [Candidatus Lokiarchaeota archaeon]
MSWFWATLELTNPGEVNNTRFTHYAAISVRGHLYNKIDGTNKTGINVAIEVDDIIDMGFTDVTDGNGNFDINFVIDGNLDVYTSHKIEVAVTDSEPGGPGSEIEYPHFYMINVNATSYFSIISNDNPSTPKLTEEMFNLNGYLYYDNNNGIPFVSVNYFWLDGSTTISSSSFFTDIFGSLTSIQVPITVASQLTLKFNYSNPPYVDCSEISINNIKTFSDVTWNLLIDYTVTEGDDYTLTGTLSSSTDPSLKIGNRDLDIYYNGSVADTVTTASDGSFSSTFQLPMQNGTAPLQVELINSAGKTITSSIQYIVVENRPISPGGGAALPPFMIFSLIFFPILICIIVGLAVYGFFFYKKQEEESRVVNIPLESKISNLKILKDTGRLEESLSYLFNAIFMDLVRAKYNRFRKENETIRDFAIISVKDLKLTPSSIYPFIQQVEEIIYGKPYKITEKDFYKTCELFSPIYFQLTGHNFVLNF